MKMPRPSAEPLLWQSTHATLYSCKASSRRRKREELVQFAKRILVTSMALERIGINWISAHRISPVSPRPPIVAA